MRELLSCVLINKGTRTSGSKVGTEGHPIVYQGDEMEGTLIIVAVGSERGVWDEP